LEVWEEDKTLRRHVIDEFAYGLGVSSRSINIHEAKDAGPRRMSVRITTEIFDDLEPQIMGNLKRLREKASGGELKIGGKRVTFIDECEEYDAPVDETEIEKRNAIKANVPEEMRELLKKAVEAEDFDNAVVYQSQIKMIEIKAKIGLEAYESGEEAIPVLKVHLT